MKLIPRDVSWDVGTFFLPMVPNNLIASECPSCGGLAIPDGRAYNAVMNLGNSHAATKLHFTCFNQLPADRLKDCDTEWTEQVIFRLAIQAVGQ